MKKLLAVATALLSASTAHAAVIVNFAEVGGNVVATLSGSLDTTGLNTAGTYNLDVGTRADAGYIGTGVQDALVTAFSGFSGPSSWGSGAGFVYATSSTGSNFALNAGSFGDPLVFVDPGYVSGSALSGTATFASTTLAALGLADGAYNYTSISDSITVNVGGGLVPEPATWAMMIGGIGLAGGVLRRRRASVCVRFA